MKYRKLRIAWSVTWGLLAVLLCVLWVRSYWRSDNVFGRMPSRSVVYLDSSGGRLGYSYSGPENNLVYEGWSVVSTVREAGSTNSRPLFAYSSHDSETIMLIPSWLPAMVAAMLTTVPWLPYRFSLRTLLIVTTVIAVVLGIIVWAMRSGN